MNTADAIARCEARHEHLVEQVSELQRQVAELKRIVAEHARRLEAPAPQVVIWPITLHPGDRLLDGYRVIRAADERAKEGET